MCDLENLISKEREAKTKYLDSRKLYRSKKQEFDERLNLHKNDSGYIEVQKSISKSEECMVETDQEIDEIIGKYRNEEDSSERKQLKERYLQLNKFIHKLKDEKRDANDYLKEIRGKYDFKLSEEESDLLLEYKCDMLDVKSEWLELKSKEEELIANDE